RRPLAAARARPGRQTLMPRRPTKVDQASIARAIWYRRCGAQPIAPTAEMIAAGERASDSDREFFKRRPAPHVRLRRAFPEETTTVEPLGDGLQWFGLVQQIYPGARTRRYCKMPASFDADVLTEREIERLILGNR